MKRPFMLPISLGFRLSAVAFASLLVWSGSPARASVSPTKDSKDFSLIIVGKVTNLSHDSVEFKVRKQTLKVPRKYFNAKMDLRPGMMTSFRAPTREIQAMVVKKHGKR